MKKSLKYIITAAVGLLTALLILVGKGTFSQTNPNIIYADLSDAFFVPGVIILSFGVLVFASNGGAFDMLTFAVIKLFDLLKRDMTKVKYRTFYDYRKAKEGRSNKSFAYIMIVGAALTVVAAVFLILYKTL